MEIPMPKKTISKIGNTGAKISRAAEKLSHLAGQKHLLCFMWCNNHEQLPKMQKHMR